MKYSQKVKDAQQAARERIAKMRLVSKRLRHPMVTSILKALPESIGRAVDLSTSEYGTVYIYINLLDLTGFKDPLLMQVLELFAGDEWRASCQDWTGSNRANRDYEFVQDIVHDGKWGIKVCVQAYAREDSESCKIVTRGFKEELVRTPIKEIVCD